LLPIKTNLSIVEAIILGYVQEIIVLDGDTHVTLAALQNICLHAVAQQKNCFSK
jgi:hypothetical protein